MAFAYRGGVLCAEQVSLDEIARRFGPPCYVYSRALIESAYGGGARAPPGGGGAGCLTRESEAELGRVGSVAARLGSRAPIAFRVNPDIDAKTHAYISTGMRHDKFGVPYGEAERLYREAARSPHVQIVGIGCHIGSQMLQPAPPPARPPRPALRPPRG